MAMIVGPEDVIETMSAERLDELARAAGYVKGDNNTARLSRQKGRRDVLRLLEAIYSESAENARGSFGGMKLGLTNLDAAEVFITNNETVLRRIREAIEEKAKWGAEQAIAQGLPTPDGQIIALQLKPPADVPVESAVDPELVPIAVSE